MTHLVNRDLQSSSVHFLSSPTLVESLDIGVLLMCLLFIRAAVTPSFIGEELFPPRCQETQQAKRVHSQ